jgi:hypothetical protein
VNPKNQNANSKNRGNARNIIGQAQRQNGVASSTK